jgi:hypothetical protein
MSVKGINNDLANKIYYYFNKWVNLLG